MDEIRERLKDIGDPVALLTGLFVLSPIGFQVLSADGRSVLTNEAFRTLFGAEPPPEYNVFKDEIAQQQGITPLIRRAFAGETLMTPTIWYDPRELKHVRLRQGKRVAVTATLLPMADSSGQVQHVALAFKDVTAELLAQESAEAKAREAEAAAVRARFLSEASVVLSGSLDYLKLLHQVAELAAAQIADWCTVAVVDEQGRSRRIAAVHRDPRKAHLIQEYLDNFSPDNHRRGAVHQVIQTGNSLLISKVTDDFLNQFSQSAHHRRVLQELGISSCIIVPMMSGEKSAGVLSLMRSDPGHTFESADLLLAQELAYRAGVCVENAHRFALTQNAENRYREQAERLQFLAEASSVLGSSLEYEEILERITTLLIPGMADFCSVDLLQDNKLLQLAVAHRDPTQIETLRTLRNRFLPDEDNLLGIAHVIHTGNAELHSNLRTETLSHDDREFWYHLRARSAMVVPLSTGRTIFGALTLAYADSHRRYTTEDLAFVVELARRAALAVENARLYSELRASVHVRDDFLSIVGHELRTPLAALLMQIQNMQRTAKLGEIHGVRMNERLDKAGRSALRLKALINQLLDVSRISAGKLRLERHLMNLSELVEEVVSHFRDNNSAAEASRIVQTIQSQVMGEWDALRLEQVIANLLSNAVKYGRGRPVEVKLWTEGGDACLSVKDFGIGIAPDEQARLFARFERAVAAKAYGGIGLGLWIVRQTVEASGGTIQLKSAVNQGAEFIVRLPLHPSAGVTPSEGMSAVNAP